MGVFASGEILSKSFLLTRRSNILRVEYFDDEIEALEIVDPISGEIVETLSEWLFIQVPTMSLVKNECKRRLNPLQMN